MRRKPRPGPDPACKGCIYLGRLHSSEPAPSICDYIEIVGHRRGCPPGAGCTKKKLIKGKCRRKAGGMIAPIYIRRTSREAGEDAHRLRGSV